MELRTEIKTLEGMNAELGGRLWDDPTNYAGESELSGRKLGLIEDNKRLISGLKASRSIGRLSDGNGHESATQSETLIVKRKRGRPRKDAA